MNVKRENETDQSKSPTSSGTAILIGQFGFPFYVHGTSNLKSTVSPMRELFHPRIMTSLIRATDYHKNAMNKLEEKVSSELATLTAPLKSPSSSFADKRSARIVAESSVEG